MRTEMIGVTHAAFMDLQRELERLRADNHAQACAVDVLVKDNKALVAENEALRCALSDALAEMQAAGLRPDTGSEGGDGVKTLRGFGIAFLLGGSMWAVAGGCVGRLAGWW